MKTNLTTRTSGALPRLLKSTFIAGLLSALILLLSTQSSHAGSATWKASPATGDWNTATNWTTGGPPNGATDTATFATSNTTGVSLSANTQVNGIVFNSGASAFTITAQSLTLTISGVGITNNSAVMQNFLTAGVSANPGTIAFTNSATAGSGTFFTNDPGGLAEFFGTSTAANGTFVNNGSATSAAGHTQFFGTSSAGNGIFINNGGTASNGGGGMTAFFNTSTACNGTFTSNGVAFREAIEGGVEFHNTSTAGNGTFTINGATAAGRFISGGFMQFFDSSTAGDGTFTINGGAGSHVGGGLIYFRDSSTGGNATLIANAGLNGGRGGKIVFIGGAGGTAHVEVFGNGNLDLSFSGGVTISSIEGNGKVFLSSRNLSVGSNNLSTTFAGVIQDGGDAGGTGGSLTKVGTGSLSLTKANTYTGSTTVNGGTLLVKNKTGSGTGSGVVQVNAGTLGGTGTIAGVVTVGTGSGTGAFLSPGNSATKPGTLTVTNNTLTFNADSTYKCALDRTIPIATQVSAKGVTINSSAQFVFADLNTGTLTPGTVFTVINNTSSSAITGTFSNLADGSTFTSTGGTTFQASYTGGTGNDLTLTVQ